VRIYLVQSGGDLDGNDGYSYGLLRGDQTRLLVSFVDYLKTGKHQINPGANIKRRAKLVTRMTTQRNRNRARPVIKQEEPKAAP
jgi:hypothetical protein